MRAAIGIFRRNRFCEPPLKSIDLLAGVPQAGQFDTRLSHVQARPRRKIRQADTGCRDIFAQISWADIEAAPAQIIEQFRLDEVNLTQVRRRGVLLFQKEVLNGDTVMRVALDPQSLDECYGLANGLLENVPCGAADSNNLT